MTRGIILGVVLLLASSCAARKPGQFRVVTGQPEYLLSDPDRRQTPFAETLTQFNGFVAGRGWLDLRPGMDLRIENAYYQPGQPRRGLNGFLGTETARFEVRNNGTLRLADAGPGLNNRPADQVPVQDLIQKKQAQYRFHRYFYAIVFKRNGDARGAVLLGGKSANELEQLAAGLLRDPDALCGGPGNHCTIFPEACSVALEMKIVVNGTAQKVAWGSMVMNVAKQPSQLEILRAFQGKLTPLEIDARDGNALRLPLLPGDHVNWN